MLQIQFVSTSPSRPSPHHRGIAFLWHMVRCIMAVLLMVGAGKEDPGIVTR
jgi:tRNA U38,U39,U40 pseudouridine synthase TruA